MKTKLYTFDRVVRMLIGLTVLVLIFLLVNKLSNVLLPFLIAWLLAYLLFPIVTFFQFKLKFKFRVLSVIVTMLLFLGLITGIFWTLIPIAGVEIQKLSQLIESFSHTVNLNSVIPIAWQHEIQIYLSHLNLQTILKDENLMNGFKKLAPELWNFINGSLNFVLGFLVLIIVFLYLIFILLDYEKISTALFEFIPPKYKVLVTELIHDVENGMNRYFRGQALIALIVSILFSIGFLIIGLPLAIVMGIFIGVVNMVPYMKIVAIIPVLILGLLQSFENAQSFGSVILGIAIVFIAVQLTEDLFLTPRIMGKVTGLRPAIILLSLSIWGSLLGIVGLIIALPMTTLIISYYKRFVLTEIKTEEIKKVEIVKKAKESSDHSEISKI